ncbi:MAG: carboxypeptidase regulatory-like domain-containing protein [Burkholderiales bacterium]|nr:carboxypeptidase regulatory-like domain-containing protein [Burkholderiales bacterium]
MDNTPTCARHQAARCLAIAVLYGATLFTPAFAADSPIVRSGNGIPYVSGGVGEESMAQLDAHAGKYNLKLVFALKSGNYLSGVEVNIMDGAGKKLLAVTTEGPWLLVNLPKGRYRVVATLSETTVSRNVVIGSSPLQTVDFRWATE